MTVIRDGAGDARRFLYRLARYKTDLRMDFEVGETVLLGVCRSLSGSGMMGEFLEPLTTGTTGILTLYHQRSSCQVHAAVDSPNGHEVRLSFRFVDDDERQALESFLSQTQGGRSGT